MATIYITESGQSIRSIFQHRHPSQRRVYYQIIDNSDWPEKARVEGQNSFTNQMWSTDLETIQRWANEWAGEEVILIQKHNSEQL